MQIKRTRSTHKELKKKPEKTLGPMLVFLQIHAPMLQPARWSATFKESIFNQHTLLPISVAGSARFYVNSSEITTFPTRHHPELYIMVYEAFSLHNISIAIMRAKQISKRRARTKQFYTISSIQGSYPELIKPVEVIIC